jgi:hypothetical protein
MENSDIQKTCEPPSSGSPLPRLVGLFLSGQTVSRYCGYGDRGEPMNWLHVTWITADIKSDRAATWWGSGSAFINDRIVFEILRHPEQWEIIQPNNYPIKII